MELEDFAKMAKKSPRLKFNILGKNSGEKVRSWNGSVIDRLYITFFFMKKYNNIRTQRHNPHAPT